mmetsp:Transcript_16234/g.23494  ORF Transcript_16234/g.23494 Transcript_16234/m.23494 type:complete len:428 (-) Transcript_16234:51-1334(-)
MLRNLFRHSRKFSSLSVTEQVTTGRPAYLDLQSTTPQDPRVLDAMLPFQISEYGNPHSRSHLYGWSASDSVEEARTHVADLIGADPKEIIFTSGATESNNLAIKGVAKFYKQKGKNKIITTQIEHKCVLDSCRRLQEEGFEVKYLPVKTNGILDLEELYKELDSNTSLVSVMAANNEIGVVQPIKEIGEMCREKKVFFHTDAAQSVGKLPIDVDDMKIDLMSISGHKIYGPKGIGAIYVRRKPRVRLHPIINGGGQERGLRSGTLPPALVVGLGEAARIAKEEMTSEYNHVKRLADKFIKEVGESVPEIVLNGDEKSRIPGNINMSFAYVEGESLIMGLKNLAISSGSACTSASLEPSYVLRAIGVGEELAHTSLRIGIGRFTTEGEIDYAIELVKKHVEKLRELSPLWEMAQEGIDIKTIEWSQPH